MKFVSKTLRIFALNISVSIRVHPWLKRGFSVYFLWKISPPSFVAAGPGESSAGNYSDIRLATWLQSL